MVVIRVFGVEVDVGGMSGAWWGDCGDCGGVCNVGMSLDNGIGGRWMMGWMGWGMFGLGKN